MQVALFYVMPLTRLITEKPAACPLQYMFNWDLKSHCLCKNLLAATAVISAATAHALGEAFLRENMRFSCAPPDANLGHVYVGPYFLVQPLMEDFMYTSRAACPDNNQSISRKGRTRACSTNDRFYTFRRQVNKGALQITSGCYSLRSPILAGQTS
jgi:hypothetical protein